MKSLVRYIIVGIVCLLVGRFVLQPKAEVKEVVKYVEKKEEVKKKKKTTRIREEKKPDGTTTTETEVVENDESQTNTSIASSKETRKKSSSGISIGVLALKDLDQFSDKTEFGVLTAIPVIGNLSLVGTADTTKRIGLGLALEF
jgi:hypothetical protein